MTLGDRIVCDACLSLVPRLHLLRWRFDLGAILSWLAGELRLDGAIRQVDDRLWMLGRLPGDGVRPQCFFGRTGPLSPHGQRRLRAFHDVLLLTSLPRGRTLDGFEGECVSLLELLRQDRRSLRLVDVSLLLQRGAAVRFDHESGALSAGAIQLGDVPPGSKEHALLYCLSEHLDRFVSYAEIKYFVVRHTGSKDSTDEASFCQDLKRRIKRKIPDIGRLIVTTQKADGYRLRGCMDRSRRGAEAR